MPIETTTHIVPNTLGFWLCPSAEERMAVALSTGAFVKVDKLFYFKVHGRNAAMASRTVKTPQGTIMKGHWYAPLYREDRDAIRQAFDRGEARFQTTHNTWLEIRDSNLTHSQLQRLLIKANLANLRWRIPKRIAGSDRRAYRKAKRESMGGVIPGNRDIF